jgi:hypothetical protein
LNDGNLDDDFARYDEYKEDEDKDDEDEDDDDEEDYLDEIECISSYINNIASMNIYDNINELTSLEHDIALKVVYELVSFICESTDPYKNWVAVNKILEIPKSVLSTFIKECINADMFGEGRGQHGNFYMICSAISDELLYWALDMPIYYKKGRPEVIVNRKLFYIKTLQTSDHYPGFGKRL